jgi:hypothetical protein
LPLAVFAAFRHAAACIRYFAYAISISRHDILHFITGCRHFRRRCYATAADADYFHWPASMLISPLTPFSPPRFHCWLCFLRILRHAFHSSPGRRRRHSRRLAELAFFAIFTPPPEATPIISPLAAAATAAIAAIAIDELSDTPPLMPP